jgi:DNA helicase-2/ATP-dependent DNA helicase PcrA
MNVSWILNDLNDFQIEAVTAIPRFLLVLAGAGSGKTRVLTRRIAWLLSVGYATPHSILAVTFTNKAAAEMQCRIKEMLPDQQASNLWIGTFHGIAHKLLRQHWEEARLPRAFQILDSGDQNRLLRMMLRNLNLDENKWQPSRIAGFINRCKEEGKRHIYLTDKEEGEQLTTKQYQRLYSLYQQECENSGLVDFGELLLRVYELWRDNPDLLHYYRERFRHILVDEFQDINTIQYAWLKILANSQSHVFVVGDDDQCIYGWRGSKIENIYKFADDFPGTQTIRLEQNYRSTNNILKAANAIITHNTVRLGKNLWTVDDDGEPIKVYNAFDEVDEARFVIENINYLIRKGKQLRDIAILYRSNAQSRLFEEALIKMAIPYQVYGGLRFFERTEVKDVLAYCRLVANRDDDLSFERAVNTPPRGIGRRTLELLRGTARVNGLSLWQGALKLLYSDAMNKRFVNTIGDFIRLIEMMDLDSSGKSLHERVQHIINCSGIIEMYTQSIDDKYEIRVENLKELINASIDFTGNPEVDTCTREDPDFFNSFLAYAALESGQRYNSEIDDCVQLMTLHMSKGLEFPVVFLVGLEEGLFPHSRSFIELCELEEERRLAYVGVTRARQHLYLSYAERRFLRGQDGNSIPSRFIREIPLEITSEVHM